jgi:protein-S-isoprenylcysteine O-methyltransferase Ste14
MQELLYLTVVVWMGAELGLQIRQLRRAGTAKSTEWASLGIILGSIWGGTALAIAADRSLPQADLPIDPAVTLLVGLVVAWAGIALRLVSFHTLGRFYRLVVQVQEAHEVVQSGPYRVMRHPAYTGLLIAMAGFGLTHDNLVAFAILIGCSLAAVLYRIRVEERVLRTELGAAYTEYADRTARLIPGVW